MIDLSPIPTPSDRRVRLEVDPAHAWVVGLVVEVRPAATRDGDPEPGDGRPAIAQPAIARPAIARPAIARTTGAWADARCTCPEFCERDHANE